MANRGCGRRGRSFGGPYAKQEPFVLFPEDVNLPDVKFDDIDVNVKRLCTWSNKFQNYWKASPYHLEETTLKESGEMHVARFSDKKKTMFTRDSLSQVLVFNDFPKELVQGALSSKKKFRWNPESGLKRLDFLEQLEKKDQGKGEKEKKEGENEEDENAENEEEEEDLSDDDYNQNEYFDDDEDDYNDVDDGEDEGIY